VQGVGVEEAATAVVVVMTAPRPVLATALALLVPTISSLNHINLLWIYLEPNTAKKAAKLEVIA